MDWVGIGVNIILALAVVGAIALVVLGVVAYKPAVASDRYRALVNLDYESPLISLDELMTMTVGTWAIVALIQWLMDPHIQYLFNLALVVLRQEGFPV